MHYSVVSGLGILANSAVLLVHSLAIRSRPERHNLLDMGGIPRERVLLMAIVLTAVLQVKKHWS